MNVPVRVTICLVALLSTAVTREARAQQGDPCNTSISPHQNYRTQSTLLVQANGTVSPTLIIGIEHKGVFRSTDGGATWARSNTGLRGYPLLGSESEPCIRELGRIVADPGDPTRLFLQRIETPGRLDMINSETGGIYRSTDSGRTWTQLTGYGNAGGGQGLAVVAGTQPTLFMGVSNGQASWMGAPAGFYNTTGVIYRSTDAGNTWTELDQRAGTALIDEYLAASQVFADATGQRIWATALVRSTTGEMAADTVQVGYLESSDGGATWIRGAGRLTDPMTDPGGRAALNGAVAPTHFDHRFIAATGTVTSPMQYSWYTLDGSTWRKTSRYLYVARYTPHDAAGLTMFGYDPFAGAPTEPQQGILKSLDGGATWTRIGALPPGVDNDGNGIRVSQFAFHPTDPQIIYAGGSYGYVWRSIDGGVSWSTLLNVDSPVVGGPNVGTPTVPGAPGKPAAAVSGPSASLTWTAPTTGGLASTYVVDIATNAAFTTQASQVSVAERTATITLPTVSQRVYIRVRGVRDGVGAGAYSDTVELPFPIATPSDVRFAATKSGASGALVAVTPAQQVTTTFGAGVPWSASEDLGWLEITAGSGTGPGRFAAAVVNPGNVIGGSTTLTGTITLTASSLGLSVTVPVMLTVDQTATATAAPFGSFDTPVANSSVQGSIAVTGWALDDVGIDRVEIWRDLITNDPAPPFRENGHPADGKVFIANGTFSEGSRPDVEGMYTTTPFRHRAGWGYLMLTWGLPNSNGTFVLTAIAWDKEGRSTVLGTKTITVANSTATRPFGSIDVPAYGATFSGHQFTFGWALTPAAGCTVAGGQQFMTIDSAPPNFPIAYGASRADIAAAFPSFSDSNAAGGAVALNSSTYTNGAHAIGWLVYDSCGNGEGIGSRFFQVLNPGARAALRSPGSALRSPGSALRSPGSSDPGITDDGPANAIAGRGPAFARAGQSLDAASVSESATPLWLVRGIGRPATVLERSATVWLSQTGRIEIHATNPANRTQDSGLGTQDYEAYLAVNGTLAPLPMGSSFDKTTGTFMWQPVAGFLGAFPIRIVRVNDGAPGRPIEEQWTTRVVVSPGVDEVLLQIDRADSSVIEGWSLDPHATKGSGIGAIHVWATKKGTSDPFFLGQAALDVRRDDVGGLYGAQFTASGYKLILPMMEPGMYEVVVYAWSERTAQWEAARTVMVTVR